MLLLSFVRTKTGDPDKPENEYDVRVQVNTRLIDVGTVTGHRYNDGYKALLRRFLEQNEE